MEFCVLPFISQTNNLKLRVDVKEFIENTLLFAHSKFSRRKVVSTHFLKSITFTALEAIFMEEPRVVRRLQYAQLSAHSNDQTAKCILTFRVSLGNEF